MFGRDTPPCAVMFPENNCYNGANDGSCATRGSLVRYPTLALPSKREKTLRDNLEALGSKGGYGGGLVPADDIRDRRSLWHNGCCIGRLGLRADGLIIHRR